MNKGSRAFIFFFLPQKCQNLMSFSFHSFYKNISFFFIMCSNMYIQRSSHCMQQKHFLRHNWLLLTVTPVKHVTVIFIWWQQIPLLLFLPHLYKSVCFKLQILSAVWWMSTWFKAVYCSTSSLRGLLPCKKEIAPSSYKKIFMIT
jgi:hypothetical protein